LPKKSFFSKIHKTSKEIKHNKSKILASREFQNEFMERGLVERRILGELFKNMLFVFAFSS
jgi:hypothetical protein